MITIILNKLGTYGKIASRKYDYGYSRLFIKYEHDLFTPSAEPIQVCKEEKSCQNTLKFNRVGSYNGLKLRTVNVYFNRFDSKFENPLVLVLIFKDPRRDAPNIFYRLSGIDSDLGSSQNLSELKKYEEEQALLNILIEENNNIKNLLTFNIVKTSGDPPPKGDNKRYNSNKIAIVDDTLNWDGNISENGFKKYKHTPQPTVKGKKGCVVYNNDPLSDENGRILSNLQVKPDSYINVYWSRKADVHILLEIVYPKTESKNEFYFHNMTSKLFWEKLDRNNFKRYTGHEFEDKYNIYQQLTRDGNKILMELLKKLELILLKILFFLVDIFNGKYGESNVKEALGNHKPRLLGSTKKVSVVDMSENTQLKCLFDEGFRVYEHNFDDVVRSFPNNQQVRLKFIRSDVEDTNFDFIAIDIGKITHTSHMYGSYKIEVTVNSNFNFKYKWIRHSCENDIFNTKFRVQFKGQYVTFNFEKSNSNLNPKVLFVYFDSDNADVFVLLVFTSKNDDKIWYLTYDNFKKNVASEKAIVLSSLSTMIAYTKSENIGSKTGYSGSFSDRSLDPTLKSFLDQERVKQCVIYIQLDNNNQLSYDSGLVKINVSEQDNLPLDGYKTYNHSFSSRINFYDISIEFKGLSKRLDITAPFENQKISSFSIYYHSSNPATPLMMSVSSDNNLTKYFIYSEFIYNTDTTVKLSDLKLIGVDQIQQELNNQYANLSSNITFDPFSTQNYPGFKVSKLKPFGNYKYYIHKPTQCFNHIELKNTGLYKLHGFTSSDYPYENLLSIFVYYHCFDKENKCPLIIQLSTKTVQVIPKPKGKQSNKDEFKVDYMSIYYNLAEIDSNTFQKTYKKTGMANRSFTNMLNETYEKVKGKIDMNFGESGSDFIDNLLFSTRNNSLYVYFHTSDPRALAFCYENKLYKRYFIDEKTSKWLYVPNVNSCLCDTIQGNTQVLSALKQIAELLCLIKSESIEKTEQKTVEIDLSKSKTVYGDVNKITVSEKKEYDSCNLFTYCIHSLSGGTVFQMVSFKTGKSGIRTRTLNEPVDNVLSVTVYFNIYVPNDPVVLQIILGDGKKKYLKGLDKENTYDSASIIECNESQFIDYLIEENDRINDRLTYQIDQNNTYLNIKVDSSFKSSHGFTIYSHKPGDAQIKTSNVLINKKILVGRTLKKDTPVEEIQNKDFKQIDVYSLDINPKFPIIVQFKDSRTNTYILNKDQNGLYWKTENFVYKDPSTTKNKLDIIFYLLKRSLVIEINNIGQFEKNHSYEIKHIDNMPNADGLTPMNTSYNDALKYNSLQKIKVSDQTNSFSYLTDNSFRCYQHDLSELKGISNVNEIAGIRLFFSQSGNNMTEIQLYKAASKSSQNRMFLYYMPDSKELNSDKIYVYFYFQDFRPLLLCYKGDVFRRIDNNNNIEWHKDPKIKCLDNQNITTTLKEVYNSMKRKMIFVKDGNMDNINKSPENDFGGFKKDGYTPGSSSSGKENIFKISKSDLIGHQRTGTTNLTDLLDQLNSKPFDSINVYRTGEGQSIQHILLLEFINDSQKTYFKRMDDKGNFWVEEVITDSSSTSLQKKLQGIKSDISDTVIYEIGNTNDSYNSNITVSNESHKPEQGFSKCTHIPKKDTHKRSLFFYGKKKIIKKGRSGYQELSELNVNKYNYVVVYFGSKTNKERTNCPLLLELNKGDLKSNTTSYYLHKREDNIYYWEPVAIETKTNNYQLINKLKEVEFDLVDSLIILLDKRNPSTSTYDQDEIGRVIGKLQPPRTINRIKMSSGGAKKITVNDETTTSKGQCVKDYGYKLIKHDFGALVSGVGGPGQYTAGIRFIIPSETSSEKYYLITLYKNDKIDPEHIKYTYYEENNNEIYVYFYGEDPRPILIGYNGSGYRPKNKNGYFTKWVKDDSINKCVCQGTTENPQLLTALFEVVGIMNEVQLEQRPNIISILDPNKTGIPGEAITYLIYQFKGEKIKIKVSYENKSCYRVYSHKPNGTGSNGSGFRLGNIKYGDVSITYTTYNPLDSVSLYYSVYDRDHIHPYLVTLEFKDSGNIKTYQCFKLNNKNASSYGWVKVECSSDLENLAYKIRSGLDINYSKEQKTKHFFNPKDCKEDDPDLGSLIGGPVGSLTGAGALGGAGYLVYAKVLVTATSVAPS